jgi:hypothetical protein
VRRVTVPVYVIAISIVLAFMLVGWTVRVNYVRGQEVKKQQAAITQQQEQTKVFLRSEVCARLLLRDEILISVLEAAAARVRRTDEDYAAILDNAILAFRFTKDGCESELPK